jgi:glycosyltransferase involved in cell wall biosynthesis
VERYPGSSEGTLNFGLDNRVHLTMKILLITHYFPEHRGGIEIVAGELSEQLARRGVEIVWIASGPSSAAPVEGITRIPMPNWNVAERRLGFPYPLWWPSGLIRLCCEVARCELLYLHDSLYIGNVVAFLCARLFCKPVVVTQHVGLVPYSRLLLRFLLTYANHTLARLVLGGCSSCIFISQKVKDYFSQFVHFRRGPLFIPNGVSTTAFRPASTDERRRLRAELDWPRDKLVMLFVGRFVEKKGLRILRSLAERFPECEWVFVGWGQEDPKKWGLANVRCLGPMDRVALIPCYQSADLLVLPSVGEGFPLVVQEAMACGTPALISSDTAQGMPGVESTTFVSSVGVEEFTEALDEILRAPEQLQARRDFVADYAHRNWDWDTCADRYCKLFVELIKPRDRHLGQYR